MMIDSEVEKSINKAHKLCAVHRTREPLQPREREFNAESARLGKSSCTAEFHRHLMFGIAS